MNRNSRFPARKRSTCIYYCTTIHCTQRKLTKNDKTNRPLCVQQRKRYGFQSHTILTIWFKKKWNKLMSVSMYYSMLRYTQIVSKNTHRLAKCGKLFPLPPNHAIRSQIDWLKLTAGWFLILFWAEKVNAEHWTTCYVL